MTSPHRIQAWLGRAKKDADMVRLGVESAEGSFAVVQEWPRDEATGQAIVDAAQEHCDDSQSPQEYRICLCAGETVRATKPLRCKPQDETTDPAGFNVEPGNANGLVAQALRHNEYLARLYLQSMSNVLGAQRSVIDSQAAELRDLRARAKNAERQAAAKGSEEDVEALARAESIIHVGEAIAASVPAVVEHFTGKSANGKATVQ
jgi:hypothetical protein